VGVELLCFRRVLMDVEASPAPLSLLAVWESLRRRLRVRAQEV